MIASRTFSATQRRERSVAMIQAAQHGVIGRDQARDAGLTDAAIARLCSSGRWHRILPGVFAAASAPRTNKQFAIAALLWAGDSSWLSHLAAAEAWELDGFGPAAVELTTTRNLRSRPGIRVHRTTEMPPGDVTRHAGLPITAVARTLIDIAGKAPVRQLETALDDALRRGLTRVEEIEQRLAAFERVKGVAKLRPLLTERSDGRALTESPLETRLFRLLTTAALPQPTRQFVILDGERFVARVDFAYPEAMVAIEADSYRWHGDRAAWQRDLRRRNELVALGWRVIHVTAADLKRSPQKLIERIKTALSA